MTKDTLKQAQLIKKEIDQCTFLINTMGCKDDLPADVTTFRTPVVRFIPYDIKEKSIKELAFDQEFAKKIAAVATEHKAVLIQRLKEL
jgi:hypothetical protein